MDPVVTPIRVLRRDNVDIYQEVNWTLEEPYCINSELVYEFNTCFGEPMKWKLSIMPPRPGNNPLAFTCRLIVHPAWETAIQQIWMIIFIRMESSWEAQVDLIQSHTFKIDNHFSYEWKSPTFPNTKSMRGEIRFSLKLKPGRVAEDDLIRNRDVIPDDGYYYFFQDDLMLLSLQLGNMYTNAEASYDIVLCYKRDKRYCHRFLLRERWKYLLPDFLSGLNRLIIDINSLPFKPPNPLPIVDAILQYCYTADSTSVKQLFISDRVKDMFDTIISYKMWRIYQLLTPDNARCDIVTKRTSNTIRFPVRSIEYNPVGIWRFEKVSCDLGISGGNNTIFEFRSFGRGQGVWLNAKVQFTDRMYGIGKLTVWTNDWVSHTDEKRFENNIEVFTIDISPVFHSTNIEEINIGCTFNFEGRMDAIQFQGTPNVDQFYPLESLYRDMRNVYADKFRPDADVVSKNGMLFPVHAPLLRHRLNFTNGTFQTSFSNEATLHFVRYLYFGKFNTRDLTNEIASELVNETNSAENYLYSCLHYSLRRGNFVNT